VAKTLPSSQLSSLKTAKGIILEESGVTSHGAILARELGIPAIVGLKNAMERLKSGESMVIDGNKGKVYPPSRNQVLASTSSNFFLEVERFNVPIATRLMLNLSQGDLLESVTSLPSEGVGLIRSELMFLELLQEKSLKQWLKPEYQEDFQQRLQGIMTQFVQAFQPKPVFYRSFGGLIEENGISQRGTSAYLIDAQLFELELRVLRQLQQQGYHNINLILPLVRHESEVYFCQQLIKKMGLDRFPTFQLWIMAEVPSVLFLLEDYLKAGVKGIAIGTNDFAQFLLGIDREQSSENYQQLFYHPALLKALKQLIQNAKVLGLSCSICGQLPVNAPPLIEKLIRWGIDTISVESASFYPVYQAIAQAERRICLDLAREQSTS
jgi:pyruvate,water dikinase